MQLADNCYCNVTVCLCVDCVQIKHCVKKLSPVRSKATSAGALMHHTANGPAQTADQPSRPPVQPQPQGATQGSGSQQQGPRQPPAPPRPVPQRSISTDQTKTGPVSGDAG